MTRELQEKRVQGPGTGTRDRPDRRGVERRRRGETGEIRTSIMEGRTRRQPLGLNTILHFKLIKELTVDGIVTRLPKEKCWFQSPVQLNEDFLLR